MFPAVNAVGINCPMNKSWFSHDSNARNSKKLIRLRQRHGAAGYGVYWMLIERLREEDDYSSEKDYAMISFDLRVDEDLIRSVVEDFGLFDTCDDGRSFTSHGLRERMDIKDVRSAAGKKGAASRWNKNTSEMAKDGKSMANDMANESFAYGFKEKESKEKKIKENYSSSSSPSPFVAVEPSEEEKEKQEFLSYMFFKDWAAPSKELEKFIAYNSLNGRNWEKMTSGERHSALFLWKQEPAQPPRLGKDFLALWRHVDITIKKYDAPWELQMDALSDGIRWDIVGNRLVLSCSQRLAEFIERHMDTLKPYILRFLRSGNWNDQTFRYNPIPPWYP